jgi:hypothetical protein
MRGAEAGFSDNRGGGQTERGVAGDILSFLCGAQPDLPRVETLVETGEGAL